MTEITTRARTIVVSRRVLQATLACVLLSGTCLVALTAEARWVVLPILAMVTIVVWLVARLWDMDGELPLCDAGFLCAVATLLYSVIPLLNYLAGGLSFTILSASRLRQYNITPEELGGFALRHVLYLLCLVMTYAYVRGRSPSIKRAVDLPDTATRQTIVILFGLLTAYALCVQAIAGPMEGGSYGDRVYAAAHSQLPLVIMQANNYAYQVAFMLRLAVLMIVIQRCSSRWWRIALLAWLSSEVAFSLVRLGSRSETVFLLLAAGVMYHRYVKPFKLRVAVPVALIFIGSFLAYGVIRDVGSDKLALAKGDIRLLSVNNEFQTLLANSYDLHQMRCSGSLEVPWQVYLNDIMGIMPPQQLLPFRKIKASAWYVEQLGLEDTGVGLMWGVVSQAVVGLDWYELAIRGALLGLIFAKIHRWQARGNRGFFGSLFYTWLCIHSYYTFRDTTLSVFTRLLVLAALTLILVRALRWLLVLLASRDTASQAV